MKSVKELLDLTGRRALVTGGAGHIALAAEEALVELGARVAILDRDEAACRERVRLLEQIRRGAAVSVPCDLLDERQTRDAARFAATELGGLDILIHCAFYAGSTPTDPGHLETRTVAEWDKSIRVNLTAAFVLVQEVRKELAASGRGSVIFVASTYGVAGPVLSLYEGTNMVNEPDYAASKGGLIQFSRYLATVLAPSIRVNAISPGGVWRGQPDSFRKRYEDRTPLRRMAREDDLKGAFAYLAGDLSSYVTGQNLIVDGGWVAW